MNVTLPYNHLRALFSAVPQQHERWVMTSLHVEPDGTLVATDGAQMTWTKGTIDGDPGTYNITPVKLPKLADGKIPVVLDLGRQVIRYRTRTIPIELRETVNYPNWRKPIEGIKRQAPVSHIGLDFALLASVGECLGVSSKLTFAGEDSPITVRWLIEPEVTSLLMPVKL